MSPERVEEEFKADVLEGCSAVIRLLALIGETGVTDHDVAKIIVEDELKLRALVKYCASSVCAGRLP